MRTRTNRGEQFFRLGRRENEDEVLRGLLHDLQQGVEALGGDHVRLVDDEDAVAGIRWRIKCAISQVTHVIDTSVGGGVQLGDVQTPWSAGSQRTAGIAHPARSGGRALRAVQRAGEDARRRCFTTAARTRE